MAIQKRLLPHSGTLKTGIVKELGVITSSVDYAVTFVRIERTTRSIFDALGDGDGSKALLFFDARNTVIKNVDGEVVELKLTDQNKGDVFVDSWDGQDYTIRNIQPMFNANKLHHYEIELT